MGNRIDVLVEPDRMVKARLQVVKMSVGKNILPGRINCTDVHAHILGARFIAILESCGAGGGINA